MSVEYLVAETQLFFLLFVRVLMVVQIAPVFSSSAIPQIAKIGLSFFAAAAMLPWAQTQGYYMPQTGLEFIFLLLGEALLGITTGLFLTLITTIFQLAGQFFSLQMGFAASQVFDPMAQITVPLMGQFLNLVSMFVLISISGLQKIFLYGIYGSFRAMRASDFIEHKDAILPFIFRSMPMLFEKALIISFPIIGTLMLVSVTMGLLAKAAPQMNLLMLGFPLNILIAFFIMFLSLPYMMELFGRLFDMGFESLSALFSGVWEGKL